MCQTYTVYTSNALVSRKKTKFALLLAVMGDQNKDQNQDRDSEPQHQDQDKTVTFITIQLDGSSKAAVVNTNSLSPASVRQ